MRHATIDELHVSPEANTSPWSDRLGWRVRTPRGVMSEADLAEVSGPRIMVVVGAMCVLLGLTVIWRGDVNETAAGFFPPAGASLVAMVVLPVRRWGWIVAGVFFPTAVGLAFGLSPTLAALWWGIANCLEPAVAAYLLRRYASRPLPPGRMMIAFMISGVVIGPLVGATFGTLGTMTSYESSWLGPWAQWWIGDGLGVLVVAPLVLSYTTRRGVRRSRGEITSFVLLVGAATALAFADIGSNGAALLPYLILVCLIWAGMRLGMRAAGAAGFVVALGANAATALGVGPFAAGNGSVDVITLQIFLVIALIASFVVAAIASQMAGRDEVHELLRYQATHDALTGLPNRAHFTEHLLQDLAERDVASRSVAVVLIDLDDFKKINDRHGHSAGDNALIAVSGLMRDSLRADDLLARIGGDEFIVLCHDLTSCDEALHVADQMSRGLDRAVEVEGVEYRFVASMGVAFVEAATTVTSTDLLRRADIALYNSKETGGSHGSRISLFGNELEASTQRRAEMDVELRGAIRRGEMWVAYQPIVNLVTGEISKFEALARWNSPRFGAVGPDEFIALAEQNGLIIQIGDWVLEQACRQTASWRASATTLGHCAATVAVNASARQLCDLAFPARVQRVLAATNLAPCALTFEITETAVMDDLEASAAVIAELCQLGIKLSMDDFGTGYSSLTNLRRIPLQTLKIDRSFVAGLGSVREDTAVVASVITLGHSCGLEIVAEGIETTSQLQHLIALGCDQGQGYLWSRPVPAEEAGALLHTTWSLEQRSPTASTGDDRVAARQESLSRRTGR